MLVIAVSVLLTWSLFAFGAVYPWTLWPTQVGCWVVAAIAFSRRSSHGVRRFRALAPWMLLPAGAIALQLVPLPQWLVGYLSPGSRHFHLQPWASGLTTFTLAPAATAHVLLAYLTFAAVFSGLVCALQSRDVAPLSAFIALLGTTASIVAIVFERVASDRMYGVWPPFDLAAPFGPFVDRNHFAGWALLALGCATGVLGASGEQARQALRARPHSIAILTARKVLRVGLALVAVATILTGIGWSLSRSATLSSIAVLCIVGAASATHRTMQGRKRLAALGAAALMVATAAIFWTGADRLHTRFSTSGVALRARLEIWSYAVRFVPDFPLTGSGLGSFGLVIPYYQRSAGAAITEYGLYDAAHNDYLQVLAEGGVLLFTAAMCALVRIGLTVKEAMSADPDIRTRWLRAGAVAGLCGIGLQELVEYPLQIPAISLACVVLIAIAVHERAPAAATTVGDEHLRAQ